MSSSNEEEGDFSESEREVTDVVPQFETLWTPLRNGLSIVGLSVQNQSRRWDCSTPALESATIALLGDEDLTSMLSIQLQRQGIDAHVAEQHHSMVSLLG